MTLITLLTDFGNKDEYAGVLKGVILNVNPRATIVDLNHNIEPQDILGAAYSLKYAYPYFPAGTIHVAVVDPGVGSTRSILAVHVDGHFFLAPDNGLLAPILEIKSPGKLVRVENRNLFLHPISRTFHGRDIFAPVAAYLSQNGKLDKLGPFIQKEQIRPLDGHKPSMPEENKIQGIVVNIDRFGNLVTNIEDRALKAMSAWDPKSVVITAGDSLINGLSESYSDVKPGRLLAIIGSRNCLEIAINQGNAAKRLRIPRGVPVNVSLES
ncbi:MAG: SAM-dependent chlorinase/fluorinase [Desulfobacteraceae bacterium]|nr:SAM-dependent chlorinase/fluorinase [Desulfobacteraceae bacterium]